MRALVVLLALAAVGSAHAEEAGCTAPEYRRLDFRIGEFEVSTGDGTRAGRSRVEAILGGCALVEHWTGAISGDGRALMYYDAPQARWKLVFVNSQGNVLQMSGVFAGDSLVLEGDDPAFDGTPGRQRMTWSPLPGGGVRQVWERSTDGGRRWAPFFEGRYVRVGGV